MELSLNPAELSVASYRLRPAIVCLRWHKFLELTYDKADFGNTRSRRHRPESPEQGTRCVVSLRNFDCSALALVANVTSHARTTVFPLKASRIVERLVALESCGVENTANQYYLQRYQDGSLFRRGVQGVAISVSIQQAMQAIWLRPLSIRFNVKCVSWFESSTAELTGRTSRGQTTLARTTQLKPCWSP